MNELIDLEQYPLHEPDSAACKTLIGNCIADLDRKGMFTLPGFVLSSALTGILDKLLPQFTNEAFTHEREHNIYFSDEPIDIEPGHPALALQKTINHTLCADQLADNAIRRIYEWPALTNFLARVVKKNALFVMDDPLARFNVMAYYENEGLNWHFDRSEFTTTLLLQAPLAGAEFQYRPNLRSDGDPNYDGVAKLLQNQDPAVETISLNAGDLNVFKGKNTAHKIKPVKGDRPRIIGVFTYYEAPGRWFTPEEQQGFYGRVVPGRV
ncbi:MAG: 2OG-Fe(II) oxygenase [Gammaproteobacteria bacterium]|nr:MAG: 2OG-Fe(II) oxygenase [Gammaproteobacteria bacterium]